MNSSIANQQHGVCIDVGQAFKLGRYPIHFHCWVAEDLHEVFDWLARERDVRYEILDEISMQDDYEFAFLLIAD